MTLASLIGGPPGDDDWLAVGTSMFAVDTLVHNVLARTGVLAAFEAAHSYGWGGPPPAKWSALWYGF